MSMAFTENPGVEYTPKYMFVSGDGQRGAGKSRHVMKEFLRKRDSVRRQNHLASRSKSRVLPWLRREDIEHTSFQVNSIAEADSSSESRSIPSSPHHSTSATGSSTGDSHASPALSPPVSVVEEQAFEDGSKNAPHPSKDLVDYCEWIALSHSSSLGLSLTKRQYTIA